MKKILRNIQCFVLAFAAFSAAASFSACGKKHAFTIALPNDATNEARALWLLEDLGYITLKEDAGITATILDIESNPYDIGFVEVEAAQVPRSLADVDYAIINSNYALVSGLDPRSALATEAAEGNPYGNILAVKSGNENRPEALALLAALESRAVADFIAEEYEGAVITSVSEPGDGYDTAVDYTLLSGTTITVAASPTPHAEILEVAKTILAEKGVTLSVVVYDDYVQPNKVVDSGEIFANYFQHLPYLENFNADQGTNVVSLGAIHLEPMGIYGGKQSSLDAIKNGKN